MLERIQRNRCGTETEYRPVLSPAKQRSRDAQGETVFTAGGYVDDGESEDR